MRDWMPQQDNTYDTNYHGFDIRLESLISFVLIIQLFVDGGLAKILLGGDGWLNF